MDPSKELVYRQLIEDVKNSYPIYERIQNRSEKQLYWCNICEEINLWTYWQGRGNLRAEIMLVGQDWGNPWDISMQDFMNKLALAGEGPIRGYMENNKNPTDNNLVELFKELHYDITKPCQELFFTNFVLGYRNNKISGNFQRRWAEKDSQYFNRLVDIIKPKVILCLGKSTFEAVIKAYHVTPRPKIKGYNTFIQSNDNPQKIVLENGQNVHVFALAHCGAIGTMNRNRGNHPEDKLLLQKEDWRRIKPYLSAQEETI